MSYGTRLESQSNGEGAAFGWPDTPHPYADLAIRNLDTKRRTEPNTLPEYPTHHRPISISQPDIHSSPYTAEQPQVIEPKHLEPPQTIKDAHIYDTPPSGEIRSHRRESKIAKKIRYVGYATMLLALGYTAGKHHDTISQHLQQALQAVSAH